MNLERRSILSNIIMEIVLVCIIIFYCTIIHPYDGCVEIFSGHDGAGAVIACFGLLWGIGAFVRLSTGWGQWGLSIVIAACLVVFGYTLHDYGFFYAILILGAWFLFLGYITSGIAQEIAMLFFIIGVILIVIGYPLRNLSSPTNPEKGNKVTLIKLQNENLCNVLVMKYDKENA